LDIFINQKIFLKIKNIYIQENNIKYGFKFALE